MAMAAALFHQQQFFLQARKLLSRRKKLIKLADRSEAGWALVEKYVEDDLADDSDDDRRMEKAERAAERMIAKRKRERYAPTKRTAARHNEWTEPLLPDGRRLHKAYRTGTICTRSLPPMWRLEFGGANALNGRATYP